MSTKETGESVLLIGAGRMGMALLKGWTASQRFARIAVVEPHPSDAVRALAARGAISLSEVFAPEGARYSAAVLAVKPQVLKTDAALLEALGKSGALLLSIAAGIGTRLIARHAGPGARIVRAMPNTPGAIGRGITVLYADAALPAKDRALAEALTAALGQTLWIADEALMDAVTAVSGSGPAYAFLLVEALAAAARAEGLDAATAERLARATVAGAGALLDADARPAADLRKEVTSPGGTTEAALKILMGEHGLEELMRRAVAAAARRGKELGGG